MKDPRYARRRRAALPAALVAFTALVAVSGAHTPLTWAGGNPFTPAMTIVLPAQQVALAPVDTTPIAPSGEPLVLDDGAVAASPAPTAADTSGGGDEAAPQGGGDSGGSDDAQPAIRHVFVVMLRDTDLVALAGDASAGTAAAGSADAAASPAPWFATRLVPQGTLLTGYDAIARGSLANGVALLSGQGPTAQTLADCPTAAGAAPADVTPDMFGDDGQQVGADGCVYPYATGTVVDQLTGAGRDWRAYVEGATSACPATPRDPFAYFHSLLDAGTCARHVAGLDRLDADLASGRKAPALLYVVPGACHDGRAAPCSAGAPAGPAAADAFLKDVVGRILASPAYADGGLVAITSDGPPPPPQPAAPAEPTPTTPAPPPPTTPTTPLPAPPTPATPTTPTLPPGQTVPTTPTPPPGQTTPTVTTPAPNAMAAPHATIPTPATYPNVGDATAAGAARVGALLISPAVAAGVTSDVPASHFTLLRAIADLFALQPLGYAGATTLTPLPESVLRANDR